MDNLFSNRNKKSYESQISFITYSISLLNFITNLNEQFYHGLGREAIKDRMGVQKYTF